MSRDEDFIWDFMWRALLIIAAIAFLVWAMRASYADCMAEKNDRFVCQTYVNSWW